jgi:hypothetical protein
MNICENKVLETLKASKYHNLQEAEIMVSGGAALETRTSNCEELAESSIARSGFEGRCR